MKSGRVFLFFLALRLLSVWVVQTSYVPDEYWQSLEVAHNLAFGYGYKTWEWTAGLRSYVYTGIFALLYKLLALVGLDTVFTVVTMPRVLQAVLTAVADHQYWRWICEQTGTQGKWAVFSLATAWFYFYCGSRTLANTFETALTMIALRAFPWKETALQASSVKYVWFVALACMIRPTAAIIWLPLMLYHVAQAPKKTTVIFKSVLISVAIGALLTSIDYYCYGQLTFTPWNFLKFNVLEGIGSFYGSQPIYWYIAIGLPAVLGLHTLPFVLGAWRTVKQKLAVEMPLLYVIIWTITIYSFLPHKEFRFLLPILPMALYISSSWLARWSQTAGSYVLWIAAILLLAGGVVPGVYFGWVHQQAPLKVMKFLSEDTALNIKSTNILYLMPCHSTPFYSHIHENVNMRFLTCQPNLQYSSNYTDEAELFFLNPGRWLDKEFAKKMLPTHIVNFDALEPQIEPFLKKHNFVPVKKLFHCHPLLCCNGASENIIVHRALSFSSNDEPVPVLVDQQYQ